MIELHLKIKQQSSGFYDLTVGTEGAEGHTVYYDFGPCTMADGQIWVVHEGFHAFNADELLEILERDGAATAEDFLGDVPHKVINQINPLVLQHMFVAKEPA